MQKNTKIVPLFKENRKQEINNALGEGLHSFAQLIKVISDTKKLTTAEFIDKLINSEFLEDTEVKYDGHPMGVYYRQLPIVTKGDIFVKVVLLVQNEGYVLVIPENVADTFKDLQENPDKLATKNMNLALYAEVNGFDVSDPNLQDVIKSAYLAAGSSEKAFHMEDVESTTDEEDSAAGDEFGGLGDIGATSSKGGGDDAGMDTFDDIADSIDDMPEISENIDPYKEFKKQTDALELTIKETYQKANKVFRDNTRVSYLKANDAIVVIEVNNKNIYNKFKKTPNVAKKTLRKFGESLRLNTDIQLVDSFIKDNKRYFVIAENKDNYWTVKHERLDPAKKESNHVEPVQSKVIRLNKSSIRLESRVNTPLRKGRKVVYESSSKA